MTPEEKANELIEAFNKRVFAGPYKATDFSNQCSTECAVIAVEETLKQCINAGALGYKIQYWQEVLTHLKSNQ